MKSKKLLLIFFIVGSVSSITLSVYFYQSFYAINLIVPKDQVGELFIPPRATIEQVTDSLQAKGYLIKLREFKMVARFMKYWENIKAGRYVLKSKMSNLEAVRLLRSGRQEPVKVTFNNVRLKKELAPKLCKNLLAREETFDSLLNDPAYVETLGFDTATIASMFLPNTYNLFWNTDADGLMKRMKREYDRFWNQQRLDLAEEIGLTPIQVSILASIVEAETKMEDEKPVVAGVYLNRLDRNMALEADPTVVFAVGDFSLKRVLFKHLEVDSPYNTYKYTGLPPGPINIPALSSIDAVLNYERHRYLYFCVKPDFSGYHDFATNYRDHINNANRYHRALRARLRKN